MLNQAFTTALLLTGSVQRAESAVLEAIEAVDSEEMSAELMLLASVRAALATVRGKPASVREVEESSSRLPLELRRVLRLPRDLRTSYVLRILAQFTVDDCARLLDANTESIDERTCAAATELAGAVDPSFRYYMHDTSAAFRFQLVGDLSAGGARMLDQAWRTAASASSGRALIVDLSAVTGIDSAGRQLLHKWHSEGARIVVVPAESRARIASLSGLPVTLLGIQRSAPFGYRLGMNQKAPSAAGSA